jgi:hypothetical protein
MPSTDPVGTVPPRGARGMGAGEQKQQTAPRGPLLPGRKNVRREPDPETQRKYIALLRAFTAKHGRTPTAAECGSGALGLERRNREVPDYSSLCWHFGSFREALLAADLEPRRHGVRPADEDKERKHMRSGQPSYAATNRIECPVDRRHRPQMVYVRRNGVITGAMVAWCYECNREVPQEEKTA